MGPWCSISLGLIFKGESYTIVVSRATLVAMIVDCAWDDTETPCQAWGILASIVESRTFIGLGFAGRLLCLVRL